MKFFYFIELTWLLMDTLSGYFINNGISLPMGQSVSSLFRIIVSAYCVVFIVMKQPLEITSKLTLFSVLMATFLSLLHLFLYGVTEIIYGLQYFLKLCLPILLFGVIKYQVEMGFLNWGQLKNIVYFNFFVLSSNVIMGSLGFGFTKYASVDEDVIGGGKGFFFSGNELSAAFLALVALLLIFNSDKSMKKTTIVLFFSFIIAILLFSKTTFAGFLLIVMFFLFFIIRSKYVLFSMFVFPPVLALVTYDLWSSFLLNAFRRWEHFLSVGTSLADGLTSGRTRRLDELWGVVAKEGDGFMFWGFGGYAKQVLFVELDPFDLILYIGLPLTVLLYSFWFYLGGYGLFTYKKYSLRLSLLSSYTIFLLIAVGALAGHVMHSAMLAPFLILLWAAPQVYVNCDVKYNSTVKATS